MTKPIADEILYVDVTLTWASDSQTGVQRVLRQIVSSWYALNRNVYLIYFQNGEYSVLPKSALETFDSLYSLRVPRSHTPRRFFFKLFLKPYLKAKLILPQPMIEALLQSRIMKTGRKTLKQLWIPENSVILDPTNANILLLDFVFDLNQIKYLKEIVNSYATKLTYFNVDCNPIVAPGYYPDDLCKVFKEFVDLAHYANKIWSISRSAQEDLKLISKNLQNEVTFEFKWLPPFDFPNCNHTEFKKTKFPNNPYVLMVSSFVPNKNHLGFLDSLLQLKAKGVVIPKIYLVGGVSWLVEGLEAKISEALKSGIQIEKLQNIDDCCLGKLYESSMFTVLPSFIEGFGLPIVESLSFGKPVLTSKATSTGELLALPGTIGYSLEGEPSLTATLEKLLTDNELLERLMEDAEKNRNNLGTWAEYADALYDFTMKKDK
jgi:glycosyltransferase involved in cell wall biosynthesis